MTRQPLANGNIAANFFCVRIQEIALSKCTNHFTRIVSYIVIILVVM